MDLDIERLLRAVKDTRVRSSANVTNEYLSWLEDSAKERPNAQIALSTGQVKASLKRSLGEGAPLAFTVALSMARTPEDHARLWDLLGEVYRPEEEGDMEILLWPVCATIGAEETIRIPRTIPAQEFDRALRSPRPSNTGPGTPGSDPVPGGPLSCSDSDSASPGNSFLGLRELAMADPGPALPDPEEDEGFEPPMWAPVLLDADEVSVFPPDTWYRIKKGGPEAFEAFCRTLPEEPIVMGATAGCRLFFHVSCAPWSPTAPKLRVDGDLLMRMMEIWARVLDLEKSVIYPVPLAPSDPSRAYRAGVDCLRGMSLLAANSDILKSIRLRGGSPGVALAAREGGRVACLYYDVDSPLSPPASYDVRLGPADDLGKVLGELVALYRDCAVRSLYVMSDVLKGDKSAPSGWRAVRARPGFLLIGS